MGEMRVVIMDNDTGRSENVTPNKEGTFEFKEIVSGGYRLQVVTTGNHSVHQVPYVYVASGKNCDLGNLIVENIGFRLEL